MKVNKEPENLLAVAEAYLAVVVAYLVARLVLVVAVERTLCLGHL